LSNKIEKFQQEFHRMKELTFAPGLLLALSLATACGKQSDSTDGSQTNASLPVKNELAGETERLLIADGQGQVVRVFDIAEGAVISNFPTGGAASVYTGNSGRFAYAVQSTANQVSIIDGSLVLEDHGDHQHYDKYDPILLDSPLSGNNPIHFVVHDSYAAAFFDNDGEALILDENSLLAAERATVRIKTAMPHHGVAVPFGGSILVSRPEVLPGSPRAVPVAVDVYTSEGALTGESFGPCVSLHGEAARSKEIAFGCDDGVLIVGAVADGFESSKLLNPASPDGTKRRVGTLAAHDEVPYFVGNFGAGFYAEIDASSGNFTPVAAPLDYAQFMFSKDGSRLLFLGKDGQLAVVDTATRELLHKAPVTAAATGVDYGARDPKMAAGKNFLYITHPSNGELIVFSLEKLKEVARFKIAGEPTKLTVMSFPI